MDAEEVGIHLVGWLPGGISDVEATEAADTRRRADVGKGIAQNSAERYQIKSFAVSRRWWPSSTCTTRSFFSFSELSCPIGT